MVDLVVHRHQLKEKLGSVLSMLMAGNRSRQAAE